MRYFILFFVFFVQNSYSQSDVQSKYEVIDIGRLDDGSYYFKIENKKEKAIIIESDDSLDVTNCKKIKIGKCYSFNLEKIDTNFRGKNDKYVLVSEKGTQTVIWSSDDKYPLLLYKAKNIKGLCQVNF